MKHIIPIVLLIFCTACNSNAQKTEIYTDLEKAREYVASSFTEKVETLSISDELNDVMGLNMAIIADGILKKGYIPYGFEQHKGYRIYRYVKEE